RLQSLERRLRAQPARHGRAPPGRDEARAAATRPRAGDQLRADDDASPELPRAAAPAPLVSPRRVVTRGGSSIEPVRRLLAVLGSGRWCAEIGTAFGEGAAALAETAAHVVTVEIDPERAALALRRLVEATNVELLVGDWHDELVGRGPFGLIFFDGGPLDDLDT